MDKQMATMTDTRGLAQLYAKRIAPTSGWLDMGQEDHFVQFYEADDFIVNSIAEYVIHGLRSGETCIIAATAKHLVEVEKIICSYANGLQTARSEGRYVALDAVDTLSKFMIGDMPDEEFFSSIIGDVVAQAAGRKRGVRIFGEMVGVLCKRGNYAAAACLEELWNRLRERYTFSLFCAYPMDVLKRDGADNYMASICTTHTRVIPDESYTSLPSADERLRAIAVLQQRSKQLEAEVAELERRIAFKQVGLQVGLQAV
jgi:hypothetical protein